MVVVPHVPDEAVLLHLLFLHPVPLGGGEIAVAIVGGPLRPEGALVRPEVVRLLLRNRAVRHARADARPLTADAVAAAMRMRGRGRDRQNDAGRRETGGQD